MDCKANTAKIQALDIRTQEIFNQFEAINKQLAQVKGLATSSQIDLTTINSTIDTLKQHTIRTLIDIDNINTSNERLKAQQSSLGSHIQVLESQQCSQQLQVNELNQTQMQHIQMTKQLDQQNRNMESVLHNTIKSFDDYVDKATTQEQAIENFCLMLAQGMSLNQKQMEYLRNEALPLIYQQMKLKQLPQQPRIEDN